MGNGPNAGGGVSDAWAAMMALGINPGGMGQGPGHGGTGGGGLSGQNMGGGFVNVAGPEFTGSATLSPTGAGGTAFDPATGGAPGELMMGSLGGLGNLGGLTQKQIQKAFKTQIPDLGIPQPMPQFPMPTFGPQPSPGKTPKQKQPGTNLGSAGSTVANSDKSNKKQQKQLNPQELQQLFKVLQNIQNMPQFRSGVPNPGNPLQPSKSGGNRHNGPYPKNQNFPPSNYNPQLYDPNPLKTYYQQNTLGSGALNPFAGQGLLNPMTGGTLDQPYMQPPPFLPNSQFSNNAYASGPQQLAGNQLAGAQPPPPQAPPQAPQQGGMPTAGVAQAPAGGGGMAQIAPLLKMLGIG